MYCDDVTKQLKRHVGAFWGGVRSITEVHYPSPPFERIILIPGINSSYMSIRPLEKFFQRHFPSVEVVTVQEYYFHVQEHRVADIISRVEHILQDNRKTLIVGHSFGGIVARAAISRLRCTSHILLLATLGSPHRLEDFGVHEARVRHEVPDHCTVPIMTFGGRADAVVPEKYTGIDCEVMHITISCTHLAFLHSYRTRREVLAAIMQYLELHRGKH